MMAIATAAAALANRPPAHDQAQTFDFDGECNVFRYASLKTKSPLDRPSLMTYPSTPSCDEDKEGTIAFGMESLLDDSDEEE